MLVCKVTRKFVQYRTAINTFPIIAAKYGSEFSDLIKANISPMVCGENFWTPLTDIQSRRMFTSLN